MELSGMNMYWLLKLDDIITFLTMTGWVSVGLLAAACLFGPLVLIDMVESPPWDKLKKTAVSMAIYTICSFVVATFMPSTKQLAAIIVVPKIVNNEQVREVPEKLLNLGVEWLNELAPQSQKSD